MMNSKPSANALAAIGISSNECASLLDFVEAWDSHGGPLLVVGSGMSRFQADRKSGVPDSVKIEDWEQLIRGIRLAVTGGDRDLDGGLPNDHLGIAQAYLDRSGRRRVIDKIERAVPYKRFDPGPAHRMLCQFPWASILTTNYDDFVERAFEEAARPYCKIVNDVDLTRGRALGAVEIIKLHGCLQESPDSIVLCATDYRDYEAKRPLLAIKARLRFCEHSTLFLGFSLTDPNVNEMLDWVRDRSGGYSLPSVALVHQLPSEEERQYWVARGIHLVLLPGGQSVREFLDALYLAWTGGKSVQELPPGSSSLAELRDALDAREGEWVDRVTSLLTNVVATGTAHERSDAAHRILYGAIHNLNASQIEAIVRGLEPDVRRAFLLSARRSGIRNGGGGAGIDVEEALLEDDRLPVRDRCEVLVLRAERMEASGDVAGAKRAIVTGTELCGDMPWAPEIQGRLRRLLLRIGDASLIASALLAPVQSDDAFAHARRGADLLMMEGRTAALSWYRRALAVARTPDEKTAALLGLQACGTPGEMQDISEIDPSWPAVRDGVRPRVDQVHELEEKAGEELLRGFREGGKNAAADALRALGHLELAIVAVDDMGWPRSPSPNFTGPADSIAYAGVGLLLRADAPLDQIKRGLTLFVERGLLQLNRRFQVGALERLLEAQEATEWTRQFLCRRDDEPTYAGRSRALLTSALLPALSDVDITDHVTRVVSFPELAQGVLRETTQTELHLDLLRRHYHSLPRESAIITVKVMAEVFKNDAMAHHRYSRWAWLPIWDWTKSGSIDPQSSEVQDLVETMVAFYTTDETPDSLGSQSALRLLDELRTAGATSASHVDRLTAAFDVAIARGLETNDDVSDVLALVRARQEFRASELPTLLVQRFAGMFTSLRSSNVAGTWVNLLDTVGRHLPPEQKRLAADGIDNYLRQTLRHDDNRTLGPFPDWAGTAIHQGVNGGLLTPEQGRERLAQLANVYPESVVFALGIPGTDVIAAQKVLLAGLARGLVDNDDILRWCVWQPQGGPPGEDLERVLLGQLLSKDAESRRHAYWSLGWLARSETLTRAAKDALRHLIMEYGATDHAWQPRAAAVVAAAEMTEALSTQDLESLMERAEQDAIAGVRRAGGFLRRAREQGLPARRRGGAH